MLGTVEEVDADEDGVGWGESLIVRIKIDVTKPLARGRMFKLLGKQVLVAFQYEKLPKYCFDYGKIWHGEGGCTAKGPFKVNESKKPYGLWLRVSSPRRRIEFFSSLAAEVKGTDFVFESQSTARRHGSMKEGSWTSEVSGGGASSNQAGTKATPTRKDVTSVMIETDEMEEINNNE
jgi:hypothetical protein